MPAPAQRLKFAGQRERGTLKFEARGEFMAAIAAEAGDREISIGRVFSRAFGTLRSNPMATFGIAFLFGSLPTYALLYLITVLGSETFDNLGPAAVVVGAIFSAMVAVFLWIITQGALVRATVAYSEGGKASLGESAMAGLSVALPLFLLGILSALGLALGFLLFLVPGIILYVMWAVAAPALVEERLGPIEALGRSRYLSRGARWNVFGLTLVMTVLYWLFSALVEGLSSLWYSGRVDAMSGFPLGYLTVSVVSGTITSAIWGVIQTSLYVELRDWKDGPQTDALAEVFA
jgi:hypothetical protein